MFLSLGSGLMLASCFVNISLHFRARTTFKLGWWVDNARGCVHCLPRFIDIINLHRLIMQLLLTAGGCVSIVVAPMKVYLDTACVL